MAAAGTGGLLPPNRDMISVFVLIYMIYTPNIMNILPVIFTFLLKKNNNPHNLCDRHYKFFSHVNMLYSIALISVVEANFRKSPKKRFLKAHKWKKSLLLSRKK